MFDSATMVLLTALASVVAAVIGALIARRYVSAEALEDHLPAAGAVYATLGVLYAVILGQIVVAAWDRYSAAESAVSNEVGALFSLIRLADALPPGDGEPLRQAAFAYGDAVIDVEWPAMARGEAPSPEAAQALAAMYRAYGAVAAGPLGANPVVAASLTELDALDDARGDRLLASISGIPPLMWLVLVVGGLVTVAFTYMFSVASRTAHLLMVVAVAGTLALLLALVEGLNEPFREPMAIAPEGFAAILEDAADTLGEPVATPES